MMPLPKVLDLLNTTNVYGTMEDALERTKMDELLANNTLYTLLAIPDQAFESFFDANENFDDLDDFSDQELEDLMRYHIIPGNVRQDQMRNQLGPSVFPTLLEGDSVEIRQGFDWQVDDAVFLLQDIQSTNGVIHIINNVLIPG